MSAKSYNLFD